MGLAVEESVPVDHQTSGVQMWSAWSVRKMEEMGAMARDSLYIYNLSAATVGIWIVNSILEKFL